MESNLIQLLLIWGVFGVGSFLIWHTLLNKDIQVLTILIVCLVFGPVGFAVGGVLWMLAKYGD